MSVSQEVNREWLPQLGDYFKLEIADFKRGERRMQSGEFRGENVPVYQTFRASAHPGGDCSEPGTVRGPRDGTGNHSSDEEKLLQ